MMECWARSVLDEREENHVHHDDDPVVSSTVPALFRRLLAMFIL